MAGKYLDWSFVFAKRENGKHRLTVHKYGERIFVEEECNDQLEELYQKVKKHYSNRSKFELVFDLMEQYLLSTPSP